MNESKELLPSSLWSSAMDDMKLKLYAGDIRSNILNSVQLEFLRQNENLCIKKLARNTWDEFDMASWLSENFSLYFMYSEDGAIAVCDPDNSEEEFPLIDNVVITCSVLSTSISFTLYGTKENIEKTIEWLDTQEFTRIDVSVDWVFGPNEVQMDSVSLPLLIPALIPNAYPWLGTSIADYTSEFLNSTANVLLLQGPKGTGKTTFIKHMIAASKKNARMTFDKNLMLSDRFFIEWLISDSSDFLIIEDEDGLLESREVGNSAMAKILNATDGLLSLKRKKMVFSTNLADIEEVDSALKRPGRCFDILKFRNFTPEEAKKVVSSFYGPTTDVVLEEGKSYSLAEITNIKTSRIKF